MIVVGGGSLWILKKLGILDLRLLQDAFRREWTWIGLIVLSLLGLLLISAVRFYFLTLALGFGAPFRDVLAVNLVGQAVGQWLPGSSAMTEVLRFGMMSGWSADAGPAADRSISGSKGRLGLALLVDRVLGLGAMFAVGGLAGFIVLFRGGASGGFFAAVLSLSTISLALGFVALAAPFRPNRFLHRLASRGAGPESGPTPKNVFRRTAWEIRRILETSKEIRAHKNRAAGLILLSLAASGLNSLTLYFASQATGRPLPFPVILAAVPFTIVALFLPSGIAGFGGPQLLAAGVFRLFGTDPGTVVAACLLQNTVVLAVQTLGGGAGLVLPTQRLFFRRRLT
jgi:uncharacterized membrane protein YbhN (UPF0104 family)